MTNKQCTIRYCRYCFDNNCAIQSDYHKTCIKRIIRENKKKILNNFLKSLYY